MQKINGGQLGLRIAALSYLILFVCIPVVVVAVEGLRGGIELFAGAVTRPTAVNAMLLSVWTAGVMAGINTLMGTLTAYVLVAYRFPGKRVLSTLIDLPFAIPSLVTGVMLALLYGPQTAIGGFFEKTLSLKVIYAPPGIVLALLFINYPFVIRTVQPVLAELDFSQQEAAYTLGASPFKTFRRIIFPTIRPAMVTGALLSFARALGEFGSIIVVSGNIPNRTQTASVYIYGQVESGNMQGASAISLVLLLVAFTVTMTVDFVLRRGGTDA